MDIQNRRAVRAAASETLRCNPGDPRMVVLAYIGISAVSTLLINILITVLNNRINQTTGLAALGVRSMLATIQTCLPIAQTVALWYIQLGYQKATLSVARHRAVYPRDLLDGFRFFGPLLRAILIQAGIYLLLFFITVQVASFIFMLTPFCAEFTELVMPMMTDPDAFYDALTTDMAFYTQVGTAMLPMVPIWLVLFCAAAAPFFYNCRMVNFVLVDQPGTGALAAIIESGRMMKGNRVQLFKYDLGFWWFYVGQVVLTAVLYGDVLLPALGVSLPWNADVSYWVFSVLYFLSEGVLFYLFMNQVETTYATFYDLLRPKPQASSGGAVLGNIFDLARDYQED